MMASRFLILLLILSACAPVIRYEGRVIDHEEVSKLRVGIHKQSDLLSLFGSPTTTSNFDEHEKRMTKWYYIGQKMAYKPFEMPEVIDRQIYSFWFDEEQTLRHVEKLNMDQAKKLKFVKRTTPTLGRETTILQEFISNIGRFSPRAINNEDR